MRRAIKEKNLVYLTQLEKEMLDWGINGFLPMGPASFQPTECKSVITISYPLGQIFFNKMDTLGVQQFNVIYSFVVSKVQLY